MFAAAFSHFRGFLAAMQAGSMRWGFRFFPAIGAALIVKVQFFKREARLRLFKVLPAVAPI
jgi:hypothetical protein